MLSERIQERSLNALVNLKGDFTTDKTLRYKLITYAVNHFIADNREDKAEWQDEYLNYAYSLVTVVIAHMAHLTPNEFIRLFPITKEYNGAKYDMKDYFYTMDYINTMDREKPIGEKEIDNFLWEYHNWTIRLFIVARLGLIDEMRLRTGDKTIAEEYFSAMGVPIYHKHTVDGKSFLLDPKTGKSKKIIEKPSFLKVLLGGKHKKSHVKAN